MDSLYELAVKGLLTNGCSQEQFKNLPPEIRENLIPEILKKLKLIDEQHDEIDKLNNKVNDLLNQVKELQLRNMYLNDELDRLRSYYSSNVNIRPRPRPYPDPNFPFPEPFLNKERSRETNNFTFNLED